MKIKPYTKQYNGPVPIPIGDDSAPNKPYIGLSLTYNTHMYDRESPLKQVSDETIQANIKLLRMFKWIADQCKAGNYAYQHYFLDTHGVEYVLGNRGGLDEEDLNNLIADYEFDRMINEDEPE